MTWRYHTVNCVRVWRDYAVVGPAEIVRATALACTRAAIVALPLALPAAVPQWTYGGAIYDWPRPATLGGPSYAPFVEGGALLNPIGWEVSPRLSASSLQSPASLTDDVPQAISVSVWANPASQQSYGVRPELLTYSTPGMTEIQPAADVPEPGSALIVLAGLGVLAMLVRGERVMPKSEIESDAAYGARVMAGVVCQCGSPDLIAVKPGHEGYRVTLLGESSEGRDVRDRGGSGGAGVVSLVLAKLAVKEQVRSMSCRVSWSPHLSAPIVFGWHHCSFRPTRPDTI